MKTFLISGASSGIGQAVARALASPDHVLVLVARREERLRSLQKELSSDSTKVVILAVDVVNHEQLNKALEDNGITQIDGIIACAGCMHYMSFKEGDISLMHREIDVNCKGLINTINLGLKRMTKGNVIAISSDAGVKAFDGLSVYSGTKAFVEFFCDSLRREVSPDIKVATIAPGDVRTELLANCPDEHAKDKYGAAEGAEMLEAKDIADAVSYILSGPDRVAVNRILIEPREAPI